MNVEYRTRAEFTFEDRNEKSDLKLKKPDGK